MNPKETIENLLAGMSKFGASDLHVKVGYPPHYRVAGRLRQVDLPVIESSDYIEKMFRELAKENDWLATFSENPEDIREGILRGFDAVVFLNTTGDILNDAQQREFELYIGKGGGYLGGGAAGVVADVLQRRVAQAQTVHDGLLVGAQRDLGDRDVGGGCVGAHESADLAQLVQNVLHAGNQLGLPVANHAVGAGG